MKLSEAMENLPQWTREQKGSSTDLGKELAVPSRQETPTLAMQAALQDDRVILELKYAHPPFSMLSHENLCNTVNAMLVLIHFITAWKMPGDDSEAVSVIIEEQLRLHLLESYPTCNIKEVEYAFRQYGGVKDYGKKFNLSFFDEVMSQYMSKRREISQLEGFQKPPSLPAPSISNQQHIQTARDIYQSVKRVELQYLPAYDALLAEGLLEDLNEEHKRHFMKLAHQRAIEMKNNDERFFERRDLREWKVIYAKKLVISEYFYAESRQSNSE